MKPEHSITWTGVLWECLCGFSTDSDLRAFHHYVNDLGGHSSAPTQFQVTE